MLDTTLGEILQYRIATFLTKSLNLILLRNAKYVLTSRYV